MGAEHFEEVETELLWFEEGEEGAGCFKINVCQTIQCVQYLYQATDGADTKTSYQIKQADVCLLSSELTGKFVELKYYPYSMQPLDVTVVATHNCKDE